MNLQAVEFDFIVNNVKQTKEVYEAVFGLEIIEETNFPVGSNELVFNLAGTRFHLLDANPDYGMEAPAVDEDFPFWFNVSTEDIQGLWQKAIAAGCSELVEPTKSADSGSMTAMFRDPDGYIWMLNDFSKSDIDAFEGLAIAYVVQDVALSLETYAGIFPIDILSQAADHSEAVFTLFSTRFQIFAENEIEGLMGPGEGEGMPFWFNLVVPDLQAVWEKAMAIDCQTIQAPIHMEQMGITNAMFADSEGYVWMLHEIHEVVSFEDRVDYFEQEMGLKEEQEDGEN